MEYVRKLSLIFYNHVAIAVHTTTQLFRNPAASSVLRGKGGDRFRNAQIQRVFRGYWSRAYVHCMKSRKEYLGRVAEVAERTHKFNRLVP